MLWRKCLGNKIVLRDYLMLVTLHHVIEPVLT